MRVRFEWDEAKNEANVRKHGIDFDQASRVFFDPLHVCTLESVQEGEVRLRSIGKVAGLELILVIHVDRDEHDVDVIRIISARRPTKHERRNYEDENG